MTNPNPEEKKDIADKFKTINPKDIAVESILFEIKSLGHQLAEIDRNVNKVKHSIYGDGNGQRGALTRIVVLEQQIGAVVESITQDRATSSNWINILLLTGTLIVGAAAVVVSLVMVFQN